MLLRVETSGRSLHEDNNDGFYFIMVIKEFTLKFIMLYTSTLSL